MEQPDSFVFILETNSGKTYSRSNGCNVLEANSGNLASWLIDWIGGYQKSIHHNMLFNARLHSKGRKTMKVINWYHLEALIRPTFTQVLEGENVHFYTETFARSEMSQMSLLVMKRKERWTSIRPIRWSAMNRWRARRKKKCSFRNNNNNCIDSFSPQLFCSTEETFWSGHRWRQRLITGPEYSYEAGWKVVAAHWAC